jgi:hypothetical protein
MMIDYRPRRPGLRIFLVACAFAGTAALTACSDEENSPAPATPTDQKITMTFPKPSSSSELPNPDQITPEAAKQLCDMMRPEIDNWRAQGSTLGKVAFNGTVHNWAARNGGLNDTVLENRGIIDTITTQNCPDVRQQTLAALDISDLASGLAGFGR